MEFVNGWYLLIIVSDFLTIIGSILKIEIQIKVRGLCTCIRVCEGEITSFC